MIRLLPHDSDRGWTPFAWVIYIIPFLCTPLFARRFATPGGWALFLVTTAVFLVLYFRSYWVQGRELILLATATTALGIALWTLAPGAGAFFIYATGMLGTLASPKIAARGVAIVAVIIVAEAWLLRIDWFNAIWPLVFSVIIGGINIHYSQVGRSNARLRLAQDEIEHLAKVAERERIARDLHDVLGHTLSLVILKSELASKLAEREPERARDEIRDVERIAREALTEVRAAVRGYRSGGLEAEVERARKALATAGVALEAEVSKEHLPPAHEAVLALALREAVTNIVRHANARQCRLAVNVNSERCTMRIADDGRGGNAPFGSGLTGMRERVEALGGTLSREGSRGTVLEVALPVTVARAEGRTA